MFPFLTRKLQGRMTDHTAMVASLAAPRDSAGTPEVIPRPNSTLPLSYPGIPSDTHVRVSESSEIILRTRRHQTGDAETRDTYYPPLFIVIVRDGAHISGTA